MKTKMLSAVLAVALIAPWGMTPEARADWQIVTPGAEQSVSPRNNTATPAPAKKKPAQTKEEEREFISLLDRGLNRIKSDYKGKIQLLSGFGYWEDDSHGTWQYEKLVANLFGHGRFVYGLTVKHESYDGVKKVEEPDYKFDGEGYYLGPSFEFRHFGFNRWGFTGINVGGTGGHELSESNGRKVDGSYLRDTEIDATAGEAHLFLFRDQGAFITMASAEGFVRFDTGSTMTRNSWSGDTPGDRTYREGKVRLHTRRFWDVISLNAGYKGSYEKDRHRTWGGAIVGASFWDAIYVDAEYQHGSSDAPDKWGTGISVDVYKVGRGTVRTVRGWFRKDSGSVQNDWQIVR